MGWAQRAKEKTMAKSFVASRSDLTTRWARAIQYGLGSAAVTVIVTWADEDDDKVTGDSYVSTQYGVTSKERPIGSLPLEMGWRIAEAHLEHAGPMIDKQMEAIKDAREKAAVQAAEAAVAAAGKDGGGTHDVEYTVETDSAPPLEAQEEKPDEHE